ncbi:hypothetical protein EO244_16555 [Ancylomarina salipaludis]|uniref:Uncharacterized protein n=1 Tax=Ancylomarina salipaludis TaxID=2501299 RepID=A0A4Q1JIM7_9BACT|nr:hypothetical protein [Ancylomarina salipaludis]RXQ87289.1 hypothetical protein EO244_16555 [Ancylomarina salipaludis]
MKQISKINPKSSYNLHIFILMLGLAGLLIWLSIETKASIIIVFAITFCFLVLLFLFYSVNTKIILTDNEIVSKSPLKNRTIKYSDIKSVGVYAVSGKSFYTLEKDKYHKWLFATQKFIFVSAQEDMKLPMFRKPVDFIDFHYRKGIYELIEERINAST